MDSLELFGNKTLPEAVKHISSDIDFDKYDYELTLDTTKGKIRLEFFPEVAPNHCRNMIALAETKFYDNLLFHRVIKDFVIQGGCPNRNGTGGPGYNVDAEFNERPHEPGVLSMARAQDPNSAGSQFFLCLNRVAYLDNQYTVFGKTADKESLDVVMAIGETETGAQDRPVQEMKINSATVEKKAK